jgi:hypothetical protein
LEQTQLHPALDRLAAVHFPLPVRPSDDDVEPIPILRLQQRRDNLRLPLGPGDNDGVVQQLPGHLGPGNSVLLLFFSNADQNDKDDFCVIDVCIDR